MTLVSYDADPSTVRFRDLLRFVLLFGGDFEDSDDEGGNCALHSFFVLTSLLAYKIIVHLPLPRDFSLFLLWETVSLVGTFFLLHMTSVIHFLS